MSPFLRGTIIITPFFSPVKAQNRIKTRSNPYHFRIISRDDPDLAEHDATMTALNIPVSNNLQGGIMEIVDANDAVVVEYKKNTTFQIMEAKMLELFDKTSVNLFIHIPEIHQEYAQNCLKMVREYLDFFEQYMEIYTEEWNVYQNNIKRLKIWRYNPENKTSCLNDFDNMLINIAYVAVHLKYKYHDSEHDLSIIATINRLDYGNTPMIKNERKIDIRINNRFWKLLDITQLIDITNRSIVLLGSTFACIDYNSISPHSIYSTAFRLCTEDTYLIDPEERIPGIFWWQYISYKMLSAVSCTPDYIKKAPCRCCEIPDIESKKALGIELQLSSALEITTDKDRLRLRIYLQQFLYQPSLNLLVQYYNDPLVGYDFSMMPMTMDELHIAQKL